MDESFWDRRKVFVTGCTGLLGSWLTKSLVEAGAEVVGLIRDLVPKSNLNWSGMQKEITVVRGCVEDYFVLERTLNEYEIETCFHLAAQTIVSIANRSPLSTFGSNIKGTWNILEAARNSRLLEGIVIASSDKAYGTKEELPYKEEACLNGEHPYDVSKTCSDLLAQTYFKTYGLQVGITRCGNLYGGGDLNFNRIVPGTLRSIFYDENPIIRSDGKYMRDYFYVLDAVDSYLTLAENLHRTDVRGQAINFGTETPVSVRKIVEIMLEITGKPHLEPEILNQTSGEIVNQYLSSAKAREILGWKYRYPLEKGLSETWKWYSEFFDTLSRRKK